MQPGIHTVGGVLVAALERNLRHTVEITCAGRTDAGVHAWGQVVSLDARADVDLVALQRALNKTLRPAIAVRSAAVAPDGFDARRSATGRTYRYTSSTAPSPTRSRPPPPGTSNGPSTWGCCAWRATP